MKVDLNKYSEYLINPEEAATQGVKNIDIGGGPANILEKNKLNYALSKGLKPEQLVIILDPFDLSRGERKLIFGDFAVSALKFEVSVIATGFSAEEADPPLSYVISEAMERAKPKILGKIINQYSKQLTDKQALEKRYDMLKEKIAQLSGDSGNLRGFMNDLVAVLSPVRIKTVLLEEVLSKNKEAVYKLIQEFGDLKVRAICPECKQFTQMSLKEATPCCKVPAEKIIDTGRYIPEEGFFPVLTTMSGYIPLLSDQSKYLEPAINFIKRMKIKPKFVIRTDGEKRQTMFESYLLRGMLK